MKVLVTGASGFIGQSLCEHLQSSGLSVRAQMRRRQASAADYDCLIGELDDPAFLSIALAGVDVVIHLAGRAHQFGKDAANLNAMMAVNRDLTVRLAAEAERNGVKRFVFVSSIGVNGVETDSASIDERSPPNPIKDYALSKHEAEIALSARYIDQSGPMDLVIIRPPRLRCQCAGEFSKAAKTCRQRYTAAFFRRCQSAKHDLTEQSHRFHEGMRNPSKRWWGTVRCI